jgi:hypothetical protein
VRGPFTMALAERWARTFLEGLARLEAAERIERPVLPGALRTTDSNEGRPRA